MDMVLIVFCICCLFMLLSDDVDLFSSRIGVFVSSVWVMVRC